MSQSPLSSDDPRLTAYALGELTGAEEAAVAAAVQADPTLQAAVAEIRALGAQLNAALQDEPVMPPPVAAARVVVRRRSARSRLLKFPQIYYLTAGLAAAGLALIVAWQGDPPPSAGAGLTTRYELTLAPPVEGFEVAMPGVSESAPVTELALAPPVTLVPPAAPAMADAGRPAGSKSERERPQTVLSSSPVDGLTVRAGPLFVTGGGRAEAREAERAARVPAQPPMDTEAYAYRRDQDFLTVAQHPRSTFAAEVDTASYTLVRRFLNQGRLPPKDAVRIEELLNYFPYRYRAPVSPSDEPFAASLEVTAAPWNPAHRLVRIGLKGREVATAERAAANLVFLIDVSGSMDAPQKLPLVKDALRRLVGQLRSDDRVAIVTYAGQAGLALPSTPAARSAEILTALEALQPSGATHGSRGLQLAYDIAAANRVEGGINRIVLCTDGDFNVGVTSEGELVRLIQERARARVFLTVLGFGMGNYRDAALEQLAQHGQGQYGYIDDHREAERLLVAQVNGTLATIARDVKLQVEFNPAHVQAYRLIGYENRLLRPEDFLNEAVDAGEIGAGHTVTALYEVIPPGVALPSTPEVTPLRYQPDPASAGPPGTPSPELLTLQVRYTPPEDGARPRTLEFPLVDRGTEFTEASEDFKLAAAVAGFGMLLRDSPHRGRVTYHDVRYWVASSSAPDPGGYRQEFLDLVNQAQRLAR